MQDLRGGRVPVVQEGVAAAGSAALAVVFLADLGPGAPGGKRMGMMWWPLTPSLTTRNRTVTRWWTLVKALSSIMPAVYQPAHTARLVPHQQVHRAAGHRHVRRGGVVARAGAEGPVVPAPVRRHPTGAELVVDDVDPARRRRRCGSALAAGRRGGGSGG